MCVFVNKSLSSNTFKENPFYAAANVMRQKLTVATMA